MQYTATLTQSRGLMETPHASVRAIPAPRSQVKDPEAVMRTAGIVAVALLLIATAVVTVLTLAAHPDAPDPESWTSISVGLTDSVWAVAAAHPIEGRSTAATVDLIVARNNLASATVYPGQVLLVPGGSEAQTALAQR